MSDTRRLLAGVAVVSLVLISGCAGDGGGDDSGGRNETFAETGRLDSPTAVEPVDRQVQAEPIDLRLELIKTARITLESGDVDAVLSGLDRVVVRYGGVLEGEDVRTDDEGDIESASVVVRVPADRFEDATDEITGLATLVRERTSTEDVTTKAADVDARQTAMSTIHVSVDRA